MSLYTLDATLGADNPGAKQYRFPDDLYTALIAEGGTGHEIVVKSGVYRAKQAKWFADYISLQDIYVHWDGVGVKPVFMGVVIDNLGATGWALVSGSTTVWKKVVADTPSSYARRVFRDCFDTGGVTVSSIGVGAGLAVASAGTADVDAQHPDRTTTDEAVIVASLNAAMPAFCSNAPTLGYATYIWTGSASVNPPTYYNGIGVLQTGSGTTRGRTSPQRFGVRNASGMRFGFVPATPETTLASLGFEIWGTMVDGFGGQSTNSSSTGLKLGDIKVRYWARRGMYFNRDTAGNQWKLSNGWDIAIDRGNAASEIDPTGIPGPNDHGAEGIDLNAGSEDFWFDRPYCAAGNHGSLTMNAGKPADQLLRSGFRNFIIWINDFETDARAFATAFTGPGCAYLNGQIYNQRTKTQLRGIVRVEGNTWINPRGGAQTTGSGSYVIDFYAGTADSTGGGGASTHDDRPVDVQFNYNRIIGMQCNFARMFSASGEAIDLNTVTCKFNVIQMMDNTLKVFDQSGAGTLADQIITDNHIEVLGADPQVDWSGANEDMVGKTTNGFARNTAGPVLTMVKQRPEITTVRLALPAPV